MRVLVLAVSLSALTACAAPETWEKAGTGQEQFDVDSSACKKVEPKNGYMGGGIGATPTMEAAMHEAYARCMQGRGWNVRYK